MVGRGLGGLYAQMFTAAYDEQVVGLVLVNAVSADFYDRVRPLLPADAFDKFEQSRRDDPELRFVDESSAQVAAIGGFGDLPLVVIADLPGDPVAASENSDPPLTVAEIQALDALRQATQREQATLSTEGRLVDRRGSSRHRPGRGRRSRSAARLDDPGQVAPRISRRSRHLRRAFPCAARPNGRRAPVAASLRPSGALTCDRKTSHSSRGIRQ